MKRVILHSKKVIVNHWFIILLACAVSFVIGILVFLAFLLYSLGFTEDPVDVDDVLNEFTEDELTIILAEEMDVNVSDDEYLNLLARYQSYFCPKKIDYLTTWIGSENTNEAYIMTYDIKKEIDGFDVNAQKEKIRNSINPNCIQSIRLVRSNKNMVFRYTNTNTGKTFDIVVTSNELKAA